MIFGDFHNRYHGFEQWKVFLFSHIIHSCAFVFLISCHIRRYQPTSFPTHQVLHVGHASLQSTRLNAHHVQPIAAHAVARNHLHTMPAHLNLTTHYPTYGDKAPISSFPSHQPNDKPQTKSTKDQRTENPKTEVLCNYIVTRRKKATQAIKQKTLRSAPMMMQMAVAEAASVAAVRLTG